MSDDKSYAVVLLTCLGLGLLSLVGGVWAWAGVAVAFIVLGATLLSAFLVVLMIGDG